MPLTKPHINLLRSLAKAKGNVIAPMPAIDITVRYGVPFVTQAAKVEKTKKPTHAKRVSHLIGARDSFVADGGWYGFVKR